MDEGGRFTKLNKGKTVARLIMVIDDEQDLLTMVQDVLVWAGYEVVAANHPQRVIEQSQKRHPDLFLIDMMLPTMSGIELGQHLRRHGFANTPMIGMSASRLMRQMATTTGVFTTIIDKPFELTGLLSLLQQHMNDDITARTGQ